MKALQGWSNRHLFQVTYPMQLCQYYCCKRGHKSEQMGNGGISPNNGTFSLFCQWLFTQSVKKLWSQCNSWHILDWCSAFFSPSLSLALSLSLSLSLSLGSHLYCHLYVFIKKMLLLLKGLFFMTCHGSGFSDVWDAWQSVAGHTDLPSARVCDNTHQGTVNLCVSPRDCTIN